MNNERCLDDLVCRMRFEDGIPKVLKNNMTMDELDNYRIPTTRSWATFWEIEEARESGFERGLDTGAMNTEAQFRRDFAGWPSVLRRFANAGELTADDALKLRDLASDIEDWGF